MLQQNLFVLALILGAYASPQNPPAKEIPVKGDNGQVGGVFGISFGGARPGAPKGAQQGAPKGTQQGAPKGTGSEFPKGPTGNDNLPGTGPYPATNYTNDPSLPGHTIYAPKAPPKGVKLPALVWGNGGCTNGGTGFQNFLREIASHGFIVAANGAGGPPGLGQTKMTAMTESLDWIMKGAGGGKFGEVDTTKIATAGQSCGGLEALSAAYHDDRVKTTMVMNSGVMSADKKYLLKELKYPVAYFIGGPTDIAYLNVSSHLYNSPSWSQ
jgi:hypothetical protein